MAQSDPHYWLGKLAGTIDRAIGDLRKDDSEQAEVNLESGLREFLGSPASSAELQSYMRSVKA